MPEGENMPDPATVSAVASADARVRVNILRSIVGADSPLGRRLQGSSAGPTRSACQVVADHDRESFLKAAFGRSLARSHIRVLAKGLNISQAEVNRRFSTQDMARFHLDVWEPVCLTISPTDMTAEQARGQRGIDARNATFDAVVDLLRGGHVSVSGNVGARSFAVAGSESGGAPRGGIGGELPNVQPLPDGGPVRAPLQAGFGGTTGLVLLAAAAIFFMRGGFR